MQALRNSYPILKSLILTLSPKDAVSQGFVDSTGRPYDYAIRCFAADGQEDPLSGWAKEIIVFSLCELWHGTLLDACSAFRFDAR